MPLVHPPEVSDVCDRTSWNGTHWVGTLCDGALSHRTLGKTTRRHVQTGGLGSEAMV